MHSFSAAKTLASIPVVSPSQGAGISPPPASGYFVDQKKGEVNELKQVENFVDSESMSTNLHYLKGHTIVTFPSY